MMPLRWRLFLILIVSTGFVWLSGIAWVYFGSRSEVQHLLDRRLMEAARMVLSLSAPPGTVNAPPAVAEGVPEAPLAGGPLAYEHRLSCQIWSFDGRLLGRSGNAPAARLAAAGGTGFSEAVVDGHNYRVFAMEDARKGVRVLVGDDLAEREQVVGNILRDLLVPALVLLPLAALLTWGSVRRGLQPLRRATRSLLGRGADNLEPVELGCAPPEVRPLMLAMNTLFGKVAAARDHERNFAAYAAHELRTPLAGLKTQAQVAAAATDPAMRRQALEQIATGVDRTTRLIRQLLTISRLDGPVQQGLAEWVDLPELLDQVAGGIGRDLRPERLVIRPSLAGQGVACSRDCLDLALRNLIENALQHTPAGGGVQVGFERDGSEAVLAVEDEGPGIPEHERELVLQRFYRGRAKTASGSGLGLAIVATALDCAGAALRLRSRDGARGLRAEIRFPAGRTGRSRDGGLPLAAE